MQREIWRLSGLLDCKIWKEIGALQTDCLKRSKWGKQKCSQVYSEKGYLLLIFSFNKMNIFDKIQTMVQITLFFTNEYTIIVGQENETFFFSK